MEIGIFARTFERSSVEEVFDAVVTHGLSLVQFNMSCVGLAPMPDNISDEVIDRVIDAMDRRKIEMATLSGTYNMIHPNVKERQAGIRQLEVLAGASLEFGEPIITLCSGTRNTENMWRPHPNNNMPTAWHDLVIEMGKAAELAEEYGVTMAFEPEVANVVDSAVKARKLLDELQSPNIKVVFDGANIYHKGELADQQRILSESIDLLGEDIVVAHAKDLDQDGEAGHLAAGTGLLDYDHYLNCLWDIGFDGPLILHGLTEDQVDGCVAFLREKL